MMEKVVASLVMEKVVAILVVWLPFHDNYTTSLFKSTYMYHCLLDSAYVKESLECPIHVVSIHVSWWLWFS